jgi:hypothetical protein
MTKTFIQVTAFAFAAAVTMVTFAGTRTLAANERCKAEMVVQSGMQVLAAQTGVVVGRRA